MSKERGDLEVTEELFGFLQGTIPSGYKIDKTRIPNLSPDQAWTVVWYLENLYWQPKDSIERCCVCGKLYDSHREGECLDYGDEPPYFFCESCQASEAYAAKQSECPRTNVTPGLPGLG